MLLGGTVAGSWSSPDEWEKLLVLSRFKAVTAPFTCQRHRPAVSGKKQRAPVKKTLRIAKI